MDQVKVFLRQCVRHRFWIAVGVSILLPLIGYFVGSGPIIQATTTAESAITSANTEVQKYASGKLPNNQYPPIVQEKTAVLTKDVDATWQTLFAQQEPLLRWPEVVESRFREWGRQWPENVDRNVVTTAIYDYTTAYPTFVTNVYKSFKPFDSIEGTGIVAAPDETTLIRPAPFDVNNLPELGKIWAEQERLWIVAALLDVVKKVNEDAGAKDWDGAVVKQVNLIEVGTATSQDQVSMAEGVALEPAPELLPEGQASAAEATPGAESGMDPMMMGMMGNSGGNTNAGIVYYIKTDSTQYTSMPILMKVLVVQDRLQDFLIGLENSPISIQVLEPELAKPMTPVDKPVAGMNMNFGGYGMGGMMGMESAMSGMMMGMRGGGMGGRGGGMGGMPGMNMGMGMGSGEMMGMGMYGGGGGGAVTKQGTSIRGVNKAEEREKALKAAKEQTVTKAKSNDPYYNVIEVTVYGRARFYNAPPPPAPADSSAASPGEAPAAEPTPEAVAPQS